MVNRVLRLSVSTGVDRVHDRHLELSAMRAAIMSMVHRHLRAAVNEWKGLLLHNHAEMRMLRCVRAFHPNSRAMRRAFLTWIRAADITRRMRKGIAAMLYRTTRRSFSAWMEDALSRQRQWSRLRAATLSMLQRSLRCAFNTWCTRTPAHIDPAKHAVQLVLVQC